MEDSEDLAAEIEQLKEKFKITASQNVDKLFKTLLLHFQKSKHYEEKATQVSPADFETTFANSKPKTDFLISEDSPLNLVIDEGTDGEEPAPAQRLQQNCTQIVSQTKSKRSLENDDSDPNGILIHIKEEILDEYTLNDSKTKKQKTSSDSAKSNTKIGPNFALSNGLGDQNIEKYLKIAEKNSKDNNATKATQQMNDSSSDSDSSYEQGEINDQQKDKANYPFQNKQSFSKDDKIQRFSKINYALQPTADKHHKFKIISLNCPIDGCAVVVNTQNTQSDMNHHLNMPHSHLLYSCPIQNCTAKFKNSSDLISHGKKIHPFARVWYCRKPFCSEVLDSAEALVTHSYITHHLGTFLCVKCNFEGSSRQMMLRHYELEHSLNSSSRYRTDYTKCIYNCNTFLTNKEQFDMHLLDEHNKYPFMCLAYRCNSSFKTYAELSAHHSFVHGSITIWKCPYKNCFSPLMEDAKKLFKHMYNFHYQGRFSCMVSGCNYFSTVRAGVIQHCEDEHNNIY